MCLIAACEDLFDLALPRHTQTKQCTLPCHIYSHQRNNNGRFVQNTFVDLLEIVKTSDHAKERVGHSRTAQFTGTCDLYNSNKTVETKTKQANNMEP